VIRRFAIAAHRVATPTQLLQPGFVVVDGRSVQDVGPGPPPEGIPVADLGERIVAPGYIDQHVHGGGGAEVNCATGEEVVKSVLRLARFHATHGTTSLLATTVSDSVPALRTAVEGVAEVVEKAAQPRANGAGGGAGVLGANLEGPWISPAKAGAQFPGAIRPPSVPELEDLVARSRGTLRMVTFAPETEGALDLVRVARAHGVVPSVGHTDADYETTRAAFEAGATNVTHLFNAMSPIHHRRPGPVVAALADERAWLEIIADGVHVHPALISLVANAAPERLVLVTDAIGATGSAAGHYRLGPLEVVVTGTRAVLAERPETVAGSVLTMDRAVAFCVQVARLPLLVALQAATLHPATALSAAKKGRLRRGADADMVVLDGDLSLVATIIGGEVVHDPTGVFGELVPAQTA
jgi:N-acetylglucosamine-6-phosphate deacetylase